MTINLISDTVTKPSMEMKNFMLSAELGDDVFSNDPSVNELQELGASMFDKEAGLFCPSGTMTNQIAIKTHTQAMDEMICDVDSHVYQYENGGYAYNSRIGVNLIQGEYGKINSNQIESAIKADYDWLPNSKLVVIENTCNKGGGSIYTLEEIKALRSTCQKHNLLFHLDGARIFNALVETSDSCEEVGNQFDSISICLSKGLGAPVGSLLLGDRTFIKRARKFRKAMGGGMRQAGIIAAAGIFALKNNIERLKLDNGRAKDIGIILDQMPYVSAVKPVHSNIIIFDLVEKISPEKFLVELEKHDIKATAFGPKSIRFVTHLDFTHEMMEKVCVVLKSISFD